MTLDQATETEPYPNGKKLFYAFSKAFDSGRSEEHIESEWQNWELGFAHKWEWEQAAINFVVKG